MYLQDELHSLQFQNILTLFSLETSGKFFFLLFLEKKLSVDVKITHNYMPLNSQDPLLMLLQSVCTETCLLMSSPWQPEHHSSTKYKQ